MTEDKLPVDSLWSRRSGLVSLLVAVVVSLIGIVLDWLLVKEGLPRLDMLIFSNGLTGLFAGGLFWQMAREAKASRDLVAERMKTIAELNHHIRNALQVIKFLGGQTTRWIASSGRCEKCCHATRLVTSALLYRTRKFTRFALFPDRAKVYLVDPGYRQRRKSRIPSWP